MNDCLKMLGVVLLSLVAGVWGHGRMIDPSQRASLWRFGYEGSVPHWTDNELNCGGVGNQWGTHGGLCGSCGDPFQGPYPNEAGGTYAKGIIPRAYLPGQMITIAVDITANHKGWFEFRICANNDVTKRVDPLCLEDNLLPLADGSGTRWTLPDDLKRVYYVDVNLPAGLSCTQCVIQWKYHTANRWGTDPDTGISCTGCGPQEEFINCADVAIGYDATQHTPTVSDATAALTTTPTTVAWTTTTSTAAPTTTTTPGTTTPPGATTTTPGTTTTTTTTPATTTTSGSGMDICYAVGDWEGDPGMDDYCNINCPAYCPPTHCKCVPLK